MSNTQTRWILAGSLLVALTGCDGINVIDCDEEPDADICQDEEDIDSGSEDPDADVEDIDGGSTSDGGGTDTDARADGSSADTGTDGSSGDGDSSAPITVDDFCVAQLATAVAWRDALENLCGGTTATAAREDFLQSVLAYAAVDAEGKCIDARKKPIMAGNTTFDGTKAMACATAFAGNFMAPPSPFPTDGIDLAMYEAKIAHGAPTLIQIPECRAAFKGKLARGVACTDNFECLEGLRCLEAPGGGKDCQPALTVGTCKLSSDCADGHTCVGSPTSGGGKTCVQSDSLPLAGGNCQFSLECATDLVCNASGKCATPVADVICKP